MKLIQQGAEAKIYLNKKTIIKQRTKKSYRHPKLDNQIRKHRTKSETKILTKALSIGANVPKILNQNTHSNTRTLKHSNTQTLAHSNTQTLAHSNTDKFEIHLEFINGDRLSETLNSYPEKKQFQIMQKLGTQTAILHKNNIIHGDLTTSNIILTTGNRHTKQKDSPSPKPKTKNQKPKTDKPFLIDFGLSYISTKTEDKAVDLHLIKQALEAKHFQNHKPLFKNFLKTYNIKENIERLKIVEKRGRYKH